MIVFSIRCLVLQVAVPFEALGNNFIFFRKNINIEMQNDNYLPLEVLYQPFISQTLKLKFRLFVILNSLTKIISIHFFTQIYKLKLIDFTKQKI